MPLLPPVIATLFADTKEFMAKMDEAELKMGKFGAAADASGGKFGKFTSMASTAVVGLGAAVAAYGIDKAMKFNESLDALQNQAGLTSAQVDAASGSILNISNQTGIASTDIANAYLQASKAGLTQAQTQSVINAAAKAAVVTGGNVADTTQTLIGIQNLQIAKGMSVAQVSDLMVLANQRHVGSLDSLTSTLTGKVGGALAAAGLNLAEMASVSDIASRAGYNNARAYTQLATGLTKIESPTTASANAMAKLGINADQMATIARHPGTGLVDVLGYLEAQSKRTGVSMNTLIKDTFGPGAVGLVSDLATHIGQLSQNVHSLGGASGKGLDTSFNAAAQQLGTQMKIIETQLINSATQFGLKLLPYVKDGANILAGAMNYLSAHPAAMNTVATVLASLFVGSLATKIASVGIKLAETFGVTMEEGGLAAAIGADLAGAILTAMSLKHFIVDPVTRAIENMNNAFHSITTGVNFGSGGGGNGGGGNGGTNANGSTPAPSKVMTKEVSTVYGGYWEQNFITAAQFAALEAYFGGAAKVKALETNSSAAFYNAVRNFEGQDQNKNYSVTINVKA